MERTSVLLSTAIGNWWRIMQLLNWFYVPNRRFYRNEQKMHETICVYEMNQTSNNQTMYTYSLCRPQCIVQVNRTELCSNMAEEDVVNPLVTFWVLHVILIHLWTITRWILLVCGSCSGSCQPSRWWFLFSKNVWIHQHRHFFANFWSSSIGTYSTAITDKAMWRKDLTKLFLKHWK